MHLEPFTRVDGIPFTAARADIISAHGQPLCESRNDAGLSALDYGAVVYRFQDSGVAVSWGATGLAV